MIFVARQLLEKSREHDDQLFILFVDLKKAYDSVPRRAIWSDNKGYSEKTQSVMARAHCKNGGSQTLQADAVWRTEENKTQTW